MESSSTSSSSSSSSSSSNANVGRRILFLHGLESGPTGSKVQYMLKHFGKDAVIVPDLEMSLFDYSKENALIRNFFSFSASIEGCLNIVLNTIKKELLEGEEFILVGSSWGGLLAVRLLHDHNIRPYKTILLAPALASSRWFSLIFPSFNPEAFPSQPHKILIIHGTSDDTVPVESSRNFGIKFPDQVEVMEAEGADHGLNSYLLKRTNGHSKGRLKSVLVDQGVTPC